MIDKIKNVVEDMHEDEAKHLLQSILIQLSLLEENYSEDTIKNLMDIPNQLTSNTSYKNVKESSHVHIAFDDSTAGCLKYMLGQEERLEEMVVAFSEFFSIGPINKLHMNEGQLARQKWLVNNLTAYENYFEEEYLSRFLETMEELHTIPIDTPITIWKANNAHEHVGLCFVMAQLEDKKNIRVMNTSEASKEILKREYAIRGTGELSPESLALIQNSFLELPYLTVEKRTQFEREWDSLSKSTEFLRVWTDNEVRSVQEDYFDQFIIECAKSIGADREFLKAPRVIGEALGLVEQLVGDTFLEYRLKELIKKEVFEFEGSLDEMRFYSVKLK
ncbi:MULTISPECIES: DUF1835 domain-containing protein [Bacillus]|uniref:DUF1835 domain-containing protein n=1 Tax=Bacillus thuringiensis serovar sooncheon TaxID=180891 RepID=A0A9Q5SJX1_BACTU|nr:MULTISPECIES: DUF1835 domain-containing protein [Bacillus]MCP1163812.1 DUF1835 domain-containing protein [Bacillus sp. 1813sda1]MDC7975276.1 DUF1835 domain-containing protein [Bacillus sp. BLCC-B18]OTW71538.1 hypothetical protein BK707_06250 [Bacillus thuringiensis serovar coreanensis]OTX55160.1 hypothetical protein BK724_00900 [Bacillus thuringiensis serovar sooncheon]OTX58495.1 hypothetical protein BK725_02110 [Bacillus thuringiensis serovar guiyangiensis]